MTEEKLPPFQKALEDLLEEYGFDAHFHTSFEVMAKAMLNSLEHIDALEELRPLDQYGNKVSKH